ncbi:hypothetical protein GCM10009677_07490 [Sphaerisporangium rubeum]
MATRRDSRVRAAPAAKAAIAFDGAVPDRGRWPRGRTCRPVFFPGVRPACTNELLSSDAYRVS